jgi:ubiquinol-cytochrome c reductase cytochrome c subunit
MDDVRRGPVCVCLATAIVVASSVAIAEKQSRTSAVASARTGYDLYMRFGCYECHGTVGQGAGQFGPRLVPALPLDAFRNQLRSPASLMPVYTSAVMSEQQIVDVYSYVASLPPAKPVRDLPLLNVK